MSCSKPEVKRARPALGTLLRVHLLSADPALERVVDELFARAEELERCFSKFRDDSDLTRVNAAAVGVEVEVSAVFVRGLRLALEMYEVSGGAFTPFVGTAARLELSSLSVTKLGDTTLDLTGLAKGLIVDELSEFVTGQIHDVEGVIDAGGDLRFLGTAKRKVHVRLAPSRVRGLKSSHASVATSALSEWRHNPMSTTIYQQTPQYADDFTVTATAESCAVADALTKVGWFAPSAVRTACARHFAGEILIFNGSGDVPCDTPSPAKSTWNLL